MSEVIETNAMGGMGSKIPLYELIDARALRSIAEVMRHGAEKYAPDNWRACDAKEHVRHMIGHAVDFLEILQQRGLVNMAVLEEAVSHMACRAVMALAVTLQNPDLPNRVSKGVV